jgi:hypothetical protein
MSTPKLPVQENILVAINALIEARIGVHKEMNSDPIYPMNLDGAKGRVKIAEYKLLMALDDLAKKDDLPRSYSGACATIT